MADVDYVLSVRATSGGVFVADVGATRFLEVPASALPDPRQDVAPTSWYNDVRSAGTWTNSDGKARGDILFVIHGFNNSEAEVIQRHRLVKSGLATLGFKGVVVSFDWPSDDSALAYLPDRHRAKKSALKLVTDGIAALSAKQTPDCPINIHVLCHSTGAYVLREAFDDADDTALKQSSWTVSQILFAAGDVSSDSMSEGNAGAASIYNHCLRLTNYWNAHDVVLDISNVKRVGVAPRVGRVGLPDDAPSRSVNVSCTIYYEKLDKDPAVLAADQPGGIQGVSSHSWYFGNAIFTHDLFCTIIGTEPDVMPTRTHASDGSLQLTR